MNVNVFYSTTTVSGQMRDPGNEVKKLLGFLSFSSLPVKLSRHSCRIKLKYSVYPISVIMYKIPMFVTYRFQNDLQ